MKPGNLPVDKFYLPHIKSIITSFNTLLVGSKVVIEVSM
jgi:hypothetical protein